MSHKKVRIQFAEKHLQHQTNWSKIIFSDEKSLISMVRMVINHIGMTFEGKKDIFSKRQFGSESLMVWAGFSFGGKLRIVFLERRQNRHTNIQMLEHYLLNQGEKIAGLN